MRALFRITTEYPGRSNVYAVLGNAFHATLEDIGSEVGAERDAIQVGREAIERFLKRLDKELESARAKPRWRGGNIPANRLAALRQAVGLAAKRLCTRSAEAQQATRVLIEEPLTSRDGQLHGRPDRIELWETGATVLDFKTGDIYAGEHVARYERQLLLYALLCQDAFGIWPDEGLLVNPAQGATRAIQLDRNKADALAREAHALHAMLSTAVSPDLATPGLQCAECDYRPWCERYWGSSVAAETPEDTEFHVLEARSLGQVIYLRGKSVDGFIEVEGKLADHPGLCAAHTGAQVRLLGVPLGDAGGITRAGDIPRSGEVFVRPSHALAS